MIVRLIVLSMGSTVLVLQHTTDHITYISRYSTDTICTVPATIVPCTVDLW